jgi:membrane-associated protein
MRYPRFFSFNVIGAVAWVVLFIPAGFYFGNLPFVKKQFHYVIFVIIFLSILPAIIEIAREWLRIRKETAAQRGAAE